MSLAMVKTSVIAGGAVAALLAAVALYYYYKHYVAKGKSVEPEKPKPVEGANEAEAAVGMWPFTRPKPVTKANVPVGFKMSIV